MLGQSGALAGQRSSVVLIETESEAHPLADRTVGFGINRETLDSQLDAQRQQNRLVVGSQLPESLEADF